MIIDEIVIHNFGIYRGRHSIVLTPFSKKRPVILFGGLNGAGKTTLLDALQLALYGKLASCSNRNGQAYEEFLSSSIHRMANPKDGAALEILFRHNFNGREQAIRVHRSWSSDGKKAREHLEVLRDGTLDSVMTDSWDEYVHEIIPATVANLFFFDGEKIETFADLENSKKLLSTAIHSLLGLDIIDQLKRDLKVFEKRKQKEELSTLDRAGLDGLESELHQMGIDIADIALSRADKQNKLDRKYKELSDIEDLFQRSGGSLFENRKKIELERLTYDERVKSDEIQLREIASGSFPLLLVSDLVNDIVKQDCIEKESAKNILLKNLLDERDKAIYEVLVKAKASRNVLKTIDSFFTRDSKRRDGMCCYDNYLNLSDESRYYLLNIFNDEMLSNISKSKKLLFNIAEAQIEIDNLDRKLESSPPEEAIIGIITKREKTKHDISNLLLSIDQIDKDMDILKNKRIKLKDRIAANIKKCVSEDFKNEDVKRALIHAKKAMKTVDIFRGKVVEKHVARISELILESFTQLIRKEHLIDKIDISPDDFSFRIFGRDGEIIQPKRLSAGERQLLAASILWGLARASGRILPAIIDTPLGRLDSEHRTHLVNHYYPNASHQVILLSTDEEINAKYFKMIKPYISRSYVLEYEEGLDSTEVKKGYFW